MSHSASPSRPYPKLDNATEQLQTKLLRLAGETIGEYGLVEGGDKIMVCLSGGKDSYALLGLLRVLQRRAPIHFGPVAVDLDQQQPGFSAHVPPDYLSHIGVPFHIEERDTYSIVKRLIPEGQTTCSLCSRLRRGHLYPVATELDVTKIALGHHRDDMVETLFLNLFYTGKLKRCRRNYVRKRASMWSFARCQPYGRAISLRMRNSTRVPLFPAISVIHKRTSCGER